MINMKYLARALALLTVFSVNAFAEDVAIECDYCITESQFQTKARSMGETDTTITVNVVNFGSVAYKRYSVTKNSYIECEYNNEPDGRGGKQQICRRKFNYESHNQTISSKEMSDFIKLAKAKIKLDEFTKQYMTEITEEDTGIASGLELVGYSAAQNIVIEKFNNEVTTLGQFQDRNISYLSAASSSVKSSVIEISGTVITFKFDDDSIAYAKFELMDGDGQLHFKFLKVIFNDNTFDLQNNKAPFNSAYIKVSGLSLSNWQAVFDLLKDFGLTVRGTTRDILPKDLPKGKGRITSVCSSGDKDCTHPT